MPGIYTIATRAPGTLITGLIYNGDHQVQVDSRSAIEMQSFSATAAQMLVQADPFGADHVTENLPNSLGDELARLRFVIAQVKTQLSGGTAVNWTDPITFPGLPPIGARVQRPTTQSIPFNTQTAINFTGGVTDFSVGGVWEGIIHPTRFTAPSVGKYYVAASVRWDSITTGLRQLGYGVNGNPAAAEAQFMSDETRDTIEKQHQAIGGIVNLAANDYVEFFVLQARSSATAANLLVESKQSPVGAMIFLGS